MPLSDTAIKAAKPGIHPAKGDTGGKPYKLADAGGLFLLVQTNGGKWWRLKYRFGGKEGGLSLGTYPDVSLKMARDRRDEARRLVANGINPGAHRQIEKARKVEATGNSFEAIAREWYAKYAPTWAPSHGEKIIRRFDRDIFPWLGSTPIGDITAPALLAALRKIEARGAVETAHRVHQNCGQVFRYAVATGRAERDPSGDLRGALPPVKQEHHASITDPAAIGELLRAMKDYCGSLVTRCALQLAPLVFVRPGELRRAEWTEIDLDAAEWRIPAEKMKSRALHIVPLSIQAVAILRELHPLTGRGQYVFPSGRGPSRCMSENGVLSALRRMGYSGEQMTGHGFRSMASTLLNEQGWPRDAIERQLAHGERDKVRAAYNYAEHLPERREMMQAWADYLESLASGSSKVVAVKRAA
ncbi:MAG: integrase arm-type DNA-binding domain-containing protein [Pseudomonadota bacterium]